MSDSLEYYQNQIVSTKTELKNLRRMLAALKHEHSKKIKTVKTMLSGCANCIVTVATSISNQQSQDTPSPSEDISYSPIGYIETTFGNKQAVPRQPSVLSYAKGVVVINTDTFNNNEMSGLEKFTYMWIIFHSHSTAGTSLSPKISPLGLGGEKKGVFSTRSLHRPCPIGLSLVKIHSIEGNKIIFHGVDMINGTPVLDIKPFVPHYDYPIHSVSYISIGRRTTPFNSARRKPSVTNPVGVGTNSLNSLTHGISTAGSPLSPNQIDQSPVHRGNPDGQECLFPPQRIKHPGDGIRVPNWIINTPSQTYNVRFTDEALLSLNTLTGYRAVSFKTTIEMLLSDDPRSLNVKTKYPDHEYSCVLEDLSISCVFDSNTSVCTIVSVRNAEIIH
ncbi:tRNA (adenine(37)-N6)-methyltransferase-like isoform X1 [Pieris brassicae]|uniref:tRNA (adenine(37)-N6)-methyltransferase-like isoform X1 n=2 Tax=Pieris brassicae TaxID=7116 RepID=UPI001E65EBA4|nr:tRNA (adenine(37)-N6)-methyltransferase-like isoform X1 [Pieris brassicae]XP_045518972.1 tRNA (adenine(37)-N6)-methyltransferase-like isoform X1 [Pieris brassicae]